MNTNKTELKSHLHFRWQAFKISWQDHSNNISSIDSNVNIHQTKVSNAIEKLSIISKSDFSDKIKYDFF